MLGHGFAGPADYNTKTGRIPSLRYSSRPLLVRNLLEGSFASLYAVLVLIGQDLSLECQGLGESTSGGNENLFMSN